MDGTVILVIVMVSIFLVAMIAFQLYIHSEKKGEPEKRSDRRSDRRP
jgi:hypothetical protein